MLPAIPDPLHYGVSPISGFVPDELPLERLSNPYYHKWESIIQNLQPLIMGQRFRSAIDCVPVLSTKLLQKEGEWRRAYVILSFMAHSYVWGGDIPEERVPPPISKPFKEVCQHLELPTVATYAGVALWNWKPIFLDEPLDDLSNLATLTTFTGSMDESWFYLVSVAIESRGAPIVPIMLEAMAAVRRNDAKTVTRALQLAAERIDEIGAILNRMYEQCDPHVFYHKIRPFLAGSKNMANAGLPNGVIFDTGSEDDDYVQYGGGSNAESSLIQFFDIVLGVEHRPTGNSSATTDEAAGGSANNFILEMREYMPGPHRRFLEDVAQVANIRPFVAENRHDERLVLAFDACLAMLRAMRDKHIQMVSRYIIVKSRESRSVSPGTPAAVRNRRVNLASSRHSSGGRSDKSKLTGTGGTALIPFLKQARDETSEGVVDQWARRLLGDTPVSGQGRPMRTGLASTLDMSAGVEQCQGEIVGLAGRWTMDDTEGGICHW